MKNKKIIIILVVILALGLAVVFYQVFKNQDNKGTDYRPKLDNETGVIEDLTYTNPDADYTIVYPSSWAAQEIYSNITVLSKDTGEEFPPTIVVGVSSMSEVGATTPDEWFKANGLEDSEAMAVFQKEEVEINGMPATLVIQTDDVNNVKVMHYVYFGKDDKVIILSHAPYIEGSLEVADFESVLQSLIIL